MLIRRAIWFSVNCFRIHIARFSQLSKQTEREKETGRETGRERQGETGRDIQRPDGDLETLPMFIFSLWVSLWRFYGAVL